MTTVMLKHSTNERIETVNSFRPLRSRPTTIPSCQINPGHWCDFGSIRFNPPVAQNRFMPSLKICEHTSSEVISTDFL